jgi:tRNA C32,U32 (ribose-2'-O)-methylase TrmJ
MDDILDEDRNVLIGRLQMRYAIHPEVAEKLNRRLQRGEWAKAEVKELKALIERIYQRFPEARPGPYVDDRRDYRSPADQDG